MAITASIDISAEQRRLLLDLIHQHLPNTPIWAFGSRVKWTTRSNSDLDLVAFATPQQAPQVSALKEAFEESNLPFRVDLLVWDKLPDNFKQNIQECYAVLVEGNDLEPSFDRVAVKLENETSKSDHWRHEATRVNQASQIVGWGEERTPTIEQASVGVRTLTPTYGTEWPIVTLKDAGVVLIDCDHKTPKAEKTGFPYIGIPQLKQGRIVLDGARLISEEDFHLWRRKSKPLPNDVIMSRRCNPGETAFVPNDLEIALGQNLVLLRSDGSKLYPPFLRWVVQGPNWWNQISKFINVGAVFDSLKCANIPDFEITLPPMANQIQISKILGQLDDKIELNRQTNQTLEQIAQAIFKSWFIDFEPVKAKMAAKQAGATAEQIEQAAICAISGKTPEQLAQLDPKTLKQLKTAAALFPDALMDSELGEIPEGWEVKGLDQIANYLNGLALQKFRPKDETNFLPVLKIAQLKAGVADGGEKASPDIKPEYIVENGDVVFSWSGSLVVDVWCGGKAALNQHLFKVTSDNFPKWFFYYFTKHHLDDFQRIAAAKAVTMGHIKREHLSTALCAFNKAIIENCDAYLSTLIDQQIVLRLQNTNLADSRDSLLPKLLSGELSIESSQTISEQVL